MSIVRRDELFRCLVHLFFKALLYFNYIVLLRKEKYVDILLIIKKRIVSLILCNYSARERRDSSGKKTNYDS